MILLVLLALLALQMVWVRVRQKPAIDNGWVYPRGYEDVNAQLASEGYVIVRGCVPEETVRTFRENVGKTEVNYKNMSPVVYDVKTCLRDQFGWDPVMTKYRVSNHENKIDASFLHNDVKNLSRTNTPIPCHTVLLYGDEGKLQLIPRSHGKTHISLAHATYDLTNIITVDIHPGDLLVFNASIMHRGIFFDTEAHRRLMQIFEVYPNLETFKKFAPMVDTSYVNTSGTLETLQNINRRTSTQPMINEITNIVMYYNYRLGNQPQFNKIPDAYRSRFASNETKPRLESLDDTTMNLYVAMTDACPEINSDIRKCTSSR